MVEFNLVPLAQAVGIGVVRSGAGWLDNTLSDGKVSNFELGQLGGTIVRTIVMTAALFYSINGIFGTDISVLAAGAGAFVTDFIVNKIASRRKK